MGLLHFHMNFRINFSIKKKKKSQQGFDKDGIESVDQFGEHCHLTRSLPVHEHIK